MTNEVIQLNNPQHPACFMTACYQQPFASLYNGDCTILMRDIPDASIDCIVTDPPYKYLKNQKLEVDFDEDIFFYEAKRILKNDGFIVLFGRGSSFYRWNYILDNLNFSFKEEFIWDKSYSTSPLMPISRVHETISIHTKSNGVINKVKVPYLEMKGHDINAIVTDINRLKTVFSNFESLEAVKKYLTEGKFIYDGVYNSSTTITSKENSKKRRLDRCAAVAMQMQEGMNEKTILKEIREHYTSIHPTQKPVRLIERLLALTTKKDEIVVDPFSGSCTTGVACLNTNRKFIGYEIDKEYFGKSVERLKQYEPRLF